MRIQLIKNNYFFNNFKNRILPLNLIKEVRNKKKKRKIQIKTTIHPLELLKEKLFLKIFKRLKTPYLLVQNLNIKSTKAKIKNNPNNSNNNYNNQQVPFN